ncbi:MAG: SH3 domain-containing protein [Oscillospiraceae bacterium]|nr:SH3 domain-containing protein [Oscillospiraceae bacterium]
MLFISALFILLFSSKVQAATYTQTVKNGIENFPTSYRNLLDQLIQNTDHTNWEFQAYYTGIDWSDFVKGQSVLGLNRVYQSMDVAHRDPSNNLESGFYAANSAITSYFMDPRNFINERNIFQFLDVSYNQQLYNRSIVDDMVKKYKVFNFGNPITFKMSDPKDSNYNKNVTMTYTDIIMKAAEVSQMSPISMVIKIIQEVGPNGSDSVSGTYPGYQSCYNFFNIGAYDEGDAIVNGLKYAKAQGWFCPYYAIVQGAIFNSKNYIMAGQNTAYFYKFDCVGTKILKPGETQTISSANLYHQYMTNVQDPYGQSANLFTTYTNNGLLGKKLCFIIPIFNNMPDIVYKPSTLSNSTETKYYTTITSTLNTRTQPSSSASPVTVEYKLANGQTVSGTLFLYKDDLVIMLQRNCAIANGISWDKVKFWNGKIGYVASDYVKPFNSSGGPISGGGTGGGTINNPSIGPWGVSANSATPISCIGYGIANIASSLNIRSGAGTGYGIVTTVKAKAELLILEDLGTWYKITTYEGVTGYVSKQYVSTINFVKMEDNNVIKIIPKVTANVLAGYLNLNDYEVKNSDGNIIQDYGLATGYKISLNGIEYTIVKLGDVNGDGKSNTADAFLIQLHSVGSRKISNDFLVAGDANGDGTVNTGDALLVQRYVTGLLNIGL